MTATKLMFLRENCDCSHPVCTVITSLVRVYMHEIIGFSSNLFSQNPIWGEGIEKRQKKIKKKQTNLLAADSNCQLKTSTKPYLSQSCNNLNNPSSS